MSLEDLLTAVQAGPGGTAAAAEDDGMARPIGIPKTYRPPLSIPYTDRDNGLLPGAPPPTREPYYDGSEFAPRVLSPRKIAELQQMLGQLGLIGPNTNYKVGRWDEASSRAYKDVLAYANQGGIGAEQALQELLQSDVLRGDGQAGGALAVKPGNVTTVANPLDLEATVQATAAASLGRKFRTSEAKRFVTVYQAMQSKQAAQSNAAGDAAAQGADSTLIDAPSPGAAADQFIDSQFGQEQAGFSTLGYLDALKGLVG